MPDPTSRAVLVVLVAALSFSACTPPEGSVAARRSDALLWRGAGRLSPSVPGPNDEFGFALGLDGDLAIVGAPQASASGGAAYVFERQADGTWLEQTSLPTAGASAAARFGVAVAIQGDTALVGASDDGGAGISAGAVFVFSRNMAGTWVRTQILTASDATPIARFGQTLDLDGDTLIVGAPVTDVTFGLENAGEAYVFTRDAGGTWSEQQALRQPLGLMRGDEMGRAVAVSGDVAVVGAPRQDVGGFSDAGTVYVYERSAGVWTVDSFFFGAPRPTAFFGAAVDVDGSTFVAGAELLAPTGELSGAVRVYVDDGSGWRFGTDLFPSSPAEGQRFGSALALEGGTMLIGSVGRSPTGSVFVFERIGGAWTERQELVLGAAPGDELGFAVALDGTSALAGARLEDGAGGTRAGAAYVLGLAFEDGDACADADGCASGFCVDGVCCDVACGDGDPNDCQACSVSAGATMNGICERLGPTVTCRPGTDLCDRAEVCDGVRLACPADALLASGEVCRAATSVCDLDEICSGGSAACPADRRVDDGTPCDDGLLCNGAEICNAGACAAAGPRLCDDLDPCTVDVCVEPTGCAFEPGLCEPDAGPAPPDAGGGAEGSGGCGCGIGAGVSSLPPWLLGALVVFRIASRRRRERRGQ